LKSIKNLLIKSQLLMASTMSTQPALVKEVVQCPHSTQKGVNLSNVSIVSTPVAHELHTKQEG